MNTVNLKTSNAVHAKQSARQLGHILYRNKRMRGKNKHVSESKYNADWITLAL